MNDIKKYAVIVAGGKGLRMGNALPKQFLPLQGKPVLAHSIIAFSKAVPDIEIILVMPADQLSYGQIILQSLPDPVELTIVAGGATRFESVKNGLNAITGNGIVWIHDGARPLISSALINRCYHQALELGSAIPAVPVAESLRKVTDSGSVPVNRDEIRVIQTPQTFQTAQIIEAYSRPYDPAFTDEATVAEAAGFTVYLIEGDKKNIKITTPEDMIIAGAYMKVEQ